MKESENLGETRSEVRARASKGTKQMMWEQSRKKKAVMNDRWPASLNAKNSTFLLMGRHSVYSYNISFMSYCQCPVRLLCFLFFSFSEKSYRKVTRKSQTADSVTVNVSFLSFT